MQQSTKSRKKRTIDDYEFIASKVNGKVSEELGKGAFGQVRLAKEKATGEKVAIKTIPKQKLVDQGSQEYLKREIRLQKKLDHSHIVKLYHSFEDKENVYLVLEYASNGSLFHYARKKKKLEENETFVYFIQTTLAIDYLHKKSIIHRDLKPENILIDSQGNVKLCDFGWSADSMSERKTFCGTLDYMSPEMLNDRPHDHRVDIWALGVLLFELLHGYAPFSANINTPKEVTIKGIMNAGATPLTFRSGISEDSKNLITLLIKADPAQRATMDQIFNHPWVTRQAQALGLELQDYIYQRGLNETMQSVEESFQMSLPEKSKPTFQTLFQEQPQKQQLSSIQSQASQLNLDPNRTRSKSPVTLTPDLQKQKEALLGYAEERQNNFMKTSQETFKSKPSYTPEIKKSIMGGDKSPDLSPNTQRKIFDDKMGSSQQIIQKYANQKQMYSTQMFTAKSQDRKYDDEMGRSQRLLEEQKKMQQEIEEKQKKIQEEQIKRDQEKRQKEYEDQQKKQRELEEQQRKQKEYDEQQRKQREIEEQQRKQREKEEQQRKQREYEEQQRKQRELEDQLRKQREIEDQQKKQREFEEQQRKQREIQEQQKKQREIEEQERKIREYEEQQRKIQEQEQEKKRKEYDEQQRKLRDQEQQRTQDEYNRKQREQEQERKRQQDYEEKQRKIREYEEQQRKIQEYEEQQRILKQQEKDRKLREYEEQQRKIKQQEQQQKIQEYENQQKIQKQQGQEQYLKQQEFEKQQYDDLQRQIQRKKEFDELQKKQKEQQKLKEQEDKVRKEYEIYLKQQQQQQQQQQKQIRSKNRQLDDDDLYNVDSNNHSPFHKQQNTNYASNTNDDDEELNQKLDQLLAENLQINPNSLQPMRHEESVMQSMLQSKQLDWDVSVIQNEQQQQQFQQQQQQQILFQQQQQQLLEQQTGRSKSPNTPTRQTRFTPTRKTQMEQRTTYIGDMIDDQIDEWELSDDPQIKLLNQLTSSNRQPKKPSKKISDSQSQDISQQQDQLLQQYEQQQQQQQQQYYEQRESPKQTKFSFGENKYNQQQQQQQIEQVESLEDSYQQEKQLRSVNRSRDQQKRDLNRSRDKRLNKSKDLNQSYQKNKSIQSNKELQSMQRMQIVQQDIKEEEYNEEDLEKLKRSKSSEQVNNTYDQKLKSYGKYDFDPYSMMNSQELYQPRKTRISERQHRNIPQRPMEDMDFFDRLKFAFGCLSKRQ